MSDLGRELRDAWLAGVAGPLAEQLRAVGDLGDRLADMHADAAAAWPDVGVPPREFVEFVAARAAGEGMDALAPRHAVDLYLACGCARNDPAAIAAFERDLLAELPAMLARLRPSPDLVAEVAQVLRIALFVGSGTSPPRIKEYAGRGPLRSWLRITALREALRVLERMPTAHQPIEEAQTLATAAADDPELAYMRKLYGDAFRRAFRQAFSDIAPSDQDILRQAYIEGMGIDRLGAELGVHRATAARRLGRARSALLDSTRRALAADLEVDPSQIDSIIRLLGSQLEASVSALFRPGRGR